MQGDFVVELLAVVGLNALARGRVMFLNSGGQWWSVASSERV
jgi:hypothetical protein